MLELVRRRSDEREARSRSRPRGRDASPVRGLPFRLGRALFGGALAYMAIDNLRNLEERIGYAESKGAPAPERSVPAISAALLLGSVGVTLWRRPVLAVAAVVSFFASVTPVMHDFWALDDPAERQQQLTHFLKNTALLGAALVLLETARDRTPPRRG